MKRTRLGGEEIEPESVSMANVLMLLSRGGGSAGDSDGSVGPSHGRVFECKTCRRQFHSFQALGGHCTSHKKPRLGDGHSPAQGVPAKPKVHECSICGLEFSIGQALGGHMRRHRGLTDSLGHGLVEKKVDGRKEFFFDLNLLPSENETGKGKPGLGIGSLERVLMVDCFH